MDSSLTYGTTATAHRVFPMGGASFVGRAREAAAQPTVTRISLLTVPSSRSITRNRLSPLTPVKM